MTTRATASRDRISKARSTSEATATRNPDRSRRRRCRVAVPGSSSTTRISCVSAGTEASPGRCFAGKARCQQEFGQPPDHVVERTVIDWLDEARRRAERVAAIEFHRVVGRREYEHGDAGERTVLFKPLEH